jgi:hypothetical protein
MLDIPLSSDDVQQIAALIAALLGHIDPAALPYLAAALVAAFWHRHLWAVYLGLALLALLGWRR